jgi:hypothetical protein
LAFLCPAEADLSRRMALKKTSRGVTVFRL